MPPLTLSKQPMNDFLSHACLVSVVVRSGGGRVRILVCTVIFRFVDRFLRRGGSRSSAPSRHYGGALGPQWTLCSFSIDGTGQLRPKTKLLELCVCNFQLQFQSARGVWLFVVECPDPGT